MKQVQRRESSPPRVVRGLLCPLPPRLLRVGGHSGLQLVSRGTLPLPSAPLPVPGSLC